MLKAEVDGGGVARSNRQGTMPQKVVRSGKLAQLTNTHSWLMGLGKRGTRVRVEPSLHWSVHFLATPIKHDERRKKRGEPKHTKEEGSSATEDNFSSFSQLFSSGKERIGINGAKGRLNDEEVDEETGRWQ